MHRACSKPRCSTSPCNPINPYWETKLIGEWMAQRASAATPLRAESLRYFNVASAGWDDLGDPTAFNLIPIVFGQLAHGADPVVFDDDYPTPDGPQRPATDCTSSVR